MIRKNLFITKFILICLMFGFPVACFAFKKIKQTKISGVFGSHVFNPKMLTLNDGKVLIIRPSSPVACNVVDLYDPEKNEVYAEAAMSTCHSGGTITKLADGKVLFVGGVSGGYGSEEVSYGEVYDPKTRRFFKTGNMLEPRYNQSATLLKDGRILVIGGSRYKGKRQEWVRSAEFYNPKTNTFEDRVEFKKDLPGKKSLLLNDGNAAFFGGNDSYINIFNPYTKKFVDTPKVELSNKEERLFVLLMSDENVFIVNNKIDMWLYNSYSNTMKALKYLKTLKYLSADDVYAYLVDKKELLILFSDYRDGIFQGYKVDVSKNDVSKIGSLNDPSANYNAVLLNNGNVVIVADKPMLDGKNIVMYDVKKNKFVSLGNTLAKREKFLVHLLNNNKIFILGHYDSSQNMTTPPSGEILEIIE